MLCPVAGALFVVYSPPVEGHREGIPVFTACFPDVGMAVTAKYTLGNRGGLSPHPSSLSIGGEMCLVREASEGLPSRIGFDGFFGVASRDSLDFMFQGVSFRLQASVAREWDAGFFAKYGVLTAVRHREEAVGGRLYVFGLLTEFHLPYDATPKNPLSNGGPFATMQAGMGYESPRGFHMEISLAAGFRVSMF